MPNRPSPYQMRGWKDVAIGYDSLVFDLSASGTHLPLVALNPNTVNYTNHGSFFIHSYVGTIHPTSSEGINALPAVNSALLVGIDKRNQGGQDWVLMCEEWFNRRPAESVYLNAPVASSGDDWWYETMPNIFFYQVASRYPDAGDFAAQFRSVPEQWLLAVRAMGGKATPWKTPSMNYRAFALSTMSPNAVGVPEPEAAGAIGWILYHAYVETGEARYLRGAEWAVEYLDNLTSNPSYELQLPYGALAAARMNAELGTWYDIQKLLSWCFDVGPLRGWGAIVGNWGGYDCSGLIGEADGSGDYAFAMNTFEHIGALTPLVRYDDRFARAIGKWVLNAANAARLFYPRFLPDENQDSRVWASANDPESFVAYEALRESHNGKSPFGTGDAIGGGWAATNLGLYGSSHAGILGAIIDTTDVSMILKLDLLATDYFHAEAYPTYLYYNPYDEVKSVVFDPGAGSHDLYDAVSNSTMQSGISGATTLQIPPDAAVVLVVLPAGGAVTYDLGRMLVNGIVADYRSGVTVSNYPPRIKALAADSTQVPAGGYVTVYCTAADRESPALLYSWSGTGGSFLGSTKQVLWSAPDSTGSFILTCIVEDGAGERDTADLIVEVVTSVNHPPIITSLTARPRKVDLTKLSQLLCTAADPDGDPLSYAWSASSGTFSGSGPGVSWTAPGSELYAVITCTVTDTAGGDATDSVGILVRDFSAAQTGNLIAYYPFSGNAEDASGNQHNGIVSGAQLVPDRNGAPGAAYYFNGVSANIRVPNDTALNFQAGISLNFWMNVGAFYSREAHPLSHGNWENRWKVSITDERVRWTVKTGDGIVDLNSESKLELDSLYNVTVTYSGQDVEIFLNGELDAFRSWSGPLLQTSIDFMVGQMLPGNSNYNFRGVLDEVRLYDYQLSVPEILELADRVTWIEDGTGDLPERIQLFQNYPNPFNPVTTIRFSLPAAAEVELSVYDLLGRKVESLLSETRDAGWHSVVWDAGGYASGVYLYRLRVERSFQTGMMILMK
ncbi:MAG: LamG-like jellyroll fold domain-containing protein [Bacteroidota bacterium]